MIARKRSVVWEYFTKSEDGTADCNLCVKKRLKTAGNTSNLFSHLKARHKDIFETCKAQMEVCGSRQVTEQEVLSKPANTNIPVWAEDVLVELIQTPPPQLVSEDIPQLLCPPSPPTSLVLTSPKSCQEEAFKTKMLERTWKLPAERQGTALIHFLSDANLPLDFVELPSFQVFTRMLSPLFQVPTLENVTDELQRVYNSSLVNIIGQLASAPNISLAVHARPALGGGNILVVSAHFILDDCVHSTTLTASRLREPLSVDNIKSELEETLQSFGIHLGKVVAITADTSFAKSASIELIGEDKTIPCFVFLLNLIAKKALGKIKPDFARIIEQIANVVAFLKRCPMELEDETVKNKLDLQSLSLETGSKWSSQVAVLSRYLDLSEEIEVSLAQTGNTESCQALNAADVQLASEIVALLQPICNAIREVSGDKTHSSASLVLPLVHSLKETVDGVHCSSEPTIDMRKDLLHSIFEHLVALERNRILFATTLLDPRFKRLYKFSLVRESAAITHVANEISTEIEELIAVTSPPCRPQPELWRRHNAKVESAKTSRLEDENLSKQMPSRLKSFFNSDSLPLDKDPLVFWTSARYSKIGMELIENVARKHFLVTAKAEPSERISRVVDGLIERSTAEEMRRRVVLSSLNEDQWMKLINE